MRRASTHPRGARRAFTLLEVSLVSVLAGIFLLAAMGVFIAIDRGERRLGKRFEQTVELGRLHLTLRKVFDSIVISEEQTPPSVSGARQPVGLPRPPEEPNQTYPAPRFILGEDAALGRMTARARALAGGSGSDVLAPQRVEVVLAASPVSEPREGWERLAIAQGARAARRQPADGTTPPAGPRRAEEREDEASSGAVRGAIELRPKLNSAGLPIDPERPVWELWWTRLAPRERLVEVGQALPPAERIGEPVLLASDISHFRVRVFHGGAWHESHTTTWFQQLPAYFQVEVETASGIWAKWLFEVGWVQGPETPAVEAGEPGAGERRPDGLPGPARGATSGGRSGGSSTEVLK